MDENEYRTVYHSVNTLRCLFEKAILTRRYQCSILVKYNIADREAIGCSQQTACNRCRQILTLLHEKARFALSNVSSKVQLGHAKEIKVQCGGLEGLQKVLNSDAPSDSSKNIIDINQLLDQLQQEFDSFESLPYAVIMQSVTRFEGRKRRKKRQKK